MIQDHGWVSSQGEKRFFWIMSLSETVMESEEKKKTLESFQMTYKYNILSFDEIYTSCKRFIGIFHFWINSKLVKHKL